MLRDVVRIVWSDAHVSRFHHAWLRDHCPQSLHPSSGQRTVTIAAAARATPEAAAVGEGADGRQTLSIDWLCEPGALGISAADSAAGGGGGTDARHRSVFESGWLRAQCYADEAAQRTAVSTADGVVAPWGPEITAGSNRPIVQWAAMRPALGASEGKRSRKRSTSSMWPKRGKREGCTPSPMLVWARTGEKKTNRQENVQAPPHQIRTETPVEPQTASPQDRPSEEGQRPEGRRADKPRGTQPSRGDHSLKP